MSKGLSQLDTDYCNSTAYNPVNQICCNGNIQTRSSAHTACCGQGKQCTRCGFKNESVFALFHLFVLPVQFRIMFLTYFKMIKRLFDLHIAGSRIRYNDFVLSYVNLQSCTQQQLKRVVVTTPSLN